MPSLASEIRCSASRCSRMPCGVVAARNRLEALVAVSFFVLPWSRSCDCWAEASAGAVLPAEGVRTVLAARPTDWDGAIEVFERTKGTMPRLVKVLADTAYRAKRLAAWMKRTCCRWSLETSGKKPGQTKFEPIKWRWVVERTFGWFGRYRRLSKDYEHNPASSEAWIYIAMIHRMSRFALPERNRDDDLLKSPPRPQRC